VFDLTAIGIVCAVVIWFFRSRLTDAETLALLVLAGLLTVPAHTHSLVGLILIVPVLLRHMDQKRWVVPLALGFGALILLPRRLLETMLGPMPPVFLQLRVPGALGLGLMIIALIVLREREPSVFTEKFETESKKPRERQTASRRPKAA
jgi:hypothetical protein